MSRRSSWLWPGTVFVAVALLLCAAGCGDLSRDELNRGVESLSAIAAQGQLIANGVARDATKSTFGSRVSDQSGHSIGRVCEVRAHWERDGSILLDELIVGRSGLQHRLRGPGADRRGIPWAAVTGVEPGRIVIHG